MDPSGVASTTYEKLGYIAKNNLLVIVYCWFLLSHFCFQVVKNTLQETIDGLKLCIEKNRSIKEKKQQLFHLSQAIDSLKKLKLLLKPDDQKSIDLNLIERASREFSLLHFLVSRCQPVLSSSQKKDFESVEKELMEYLSNVFLESLSDVQTYQIDRCLRIYSNLNKVDDAVYLIRNDLVAPVLNNIISEPSLAKEEQGLRGIFFKLLEFTDGPFVPLFTMPSAVAGRFNFLVSAFWTELVQRFEVHMKSVFAAGDPNVFYQRFTDTIEFLDQLRRRCSSADVLDCHPSTIHFMQKWNLLVYYKIRWVWVGKLKSTKIFPRGGRLTKKKNRNSQQSMFRQFSTKTKNRNLKTQQNTCIQAFLVTNKC